MLAEVERVELDAPLGPAWSPVIRLVIGGIAARLQLGFDDLDDLQLAVERLLAEAAAQDTVHIAFELRESGVRASIGPLRERPISTALQGPDPPGDELALGRILETVVDSFGIEAVDGDELVVRLDKLVRPH